MNRLSLVRRTQIISCLVEGNSIRSTERMTDTHRDTVMRLMQIRTLPTALPGGERRSKVALLRKRSTRVQRAVTRPATRPLMSPVASVG